jgi:hypothetical protein
MRLYLINPCNPLVSLTRVRESYWNHYRVWKPLGLAVLAALTPPEWEISIFDENVRVPNYGALPRPYLVGITAFTSQANRAYEVAAEYRGRGVPVVMGGIHATMRPDEATSRVDAVVTGEAEPIWAEVLADIQQGALKARYAHADMNEIPPARRDLVTGVQNNWGDLSTYTTISNYGYAYDDLGRRTYKERTGLAFASSFYEGFGYDDRSELTATDYYSGTYGSGTHVPASDHDYTYDTIGNRSLYTVAQNTQTELNTNYTANQLNQYTRTVAQANIPAVTRRTYDADGNMADAYIVGDMTCDGVFDLDDKTAYNLARYNPTKYASDYPDCDPLNGDVNGDGVLNASDDALFLALLSSGNSADYVVYAWDAENR